LFLDESDDSLFNSKETEGGNNEGHVHKHERNKKTRGNEVVDPRRVFKLEVKEQPEYLKEMLEEKKQEKRYCCYVTK
jgi:hypothetical protein